MPISDVWNQGFKRLNSVLENILFSRFRRLNPWFQTSESAVFCLFAYSLDNSNFNRFVLTPFCYYHLLSTLMTFSSWFMGISILMDSVLISLDFIHVFECEFWWLIVSTIISMICHFKNIKVSILVLNIKTSSSKRFQLYFQYQTRL